MMNIEDILNIYSFEKISPKELLFRIGYPCSEDRMHRKEITKEQYELLDYYLNGEATIEWQALTDIFGTFTEKAPKLVEVSLDEMQSVDKLLQYFLIEHNKDLDNTVKEKKLKEEYAYECYGYLGTIKLTFKHPDGKNRYYIKPEPYWNKLPEYPAKNFFNLDLEKYDVYLVHKGVIILGANKIE